MFSCTARPASCHRHVWGEAGNWKLALSRSRVYPSPYCMREKQSDSWMNGCSHVCMLRSQKEFTCPFVNETTDQEQIKSSIVLLWKNTERKQQERPQHNSCTLCLPSQLHAEESAQSVTWWWLEELQQCYSPWQQPGVEAKEEQPENKTKHAS